MEIESLQTLLILILFLLGMLCIFLLTHPRGNRRSNSLLGVLLLAWLLMLVDSLGMVSDWMAAHPRFAFWSNQLFLVIGPLLYLYTRSVLDSDFRLWKQDVWHLVS